MKFLLETIYKLEEHIDKVSKSHLQASVGRVIV